MEAQAQDMPSAGPNGNGAHVETPPPPAADVPRETPPSNYEIAAATLAGDLRDFVLDQLRFMAKPWTQLGEYEQKRIIGRVEGDTRNIIRQMVALVAHHEFDHLPVEILPWQFIPGKGIKLTLFTAGTDHVEPLARHLGDAVLLLASPKEFLKARAEAAFDPDQHGLGLEDEEAERPAIDSLTDDELAMLMAGNPLRPSDTWSFTMEELTAEHMRREDEKKAHPTDAAGNPIAADPVTGEVHETQAGAAPEEAQAGEGEGGADRPADPPSSDDRIAEALEDLGHVHAAPAKRPRKKKGDDAAAPGDNGEKSFVEELRNNGGDEHLAEQIARSQSERARRAREDAGV